MKQPTIPVSEHMIQNSIIEYLTLKHWKVIRLNSGQMSKEYKGKNYFVKLGEAGMPDLMAFKKITVRASLAHLLMVEKMYLLFIEVKKPGKVATDLQKVKMEELEGYGAKCVVATCIEDLEGYV